MVMKIQRTDTGLPVRVALAKARKSGREISEAAGIPYGSLLRKLDSDREFSFTEILRIAGVLDMHPAELLPDEFKPNQKRNVA
ncbi:hypothetical protein HHJ78_11000 [Mobiluncus mulieris]|uniref:HTH cro/C1-type domain-containing protein n=2 Tax=Mobiluncus mulieris TaxID=2052 RepID=A0A7Y0U376_9ACTO|nr:hypothetical protein [Mobiluncus mulieris]